MAPKIESKATLKARYSVKMKKAKMKSSPKQLKSYHRSNNNNNKTSNKGEGPFKTNSIALKELDI